MTKENEKTDKREAGEEEKKRSTDFKKAKSQSPVVQRAARRKIISMRGVLRVTNTLGKAKSHFEPMKRDRAITLRRLLIGANNGMLVNKDAEKAEVVKSPPGNTCLRGTFRTG